MDRVARPFPIVLKFSVPRLKDHFQKLLISVRPAGERGGNPSKATQLSVTPSAASCVPIPEIEQSNRTVDSAKSAPACRTPAPGIAPA